MGISYWQSNPSLQSVQVVVHTFPKPHFLSLCLDSFGVKPKKEHFSHPFLLSSHSVSPNDLTPPFSLPKVISITVLYSLLISFLLLSLLFHLYLISPHSQLVSPSLWFDIQARAKTDDRLPVGAASFTSRASKHCVVHFSVFLILKSICTKVATAVGLMLKQRQIKGHFLAFLSARINNKKTVHQLQFLCPWIYFLQF